MASSSTVSIYGRNLDNSRFLYGCVNEDDLMRMVCAMRPGMVEIGENKRRIVKIHIARTSVVGYIRRLLYQYHTAAKNGSNERFYTVDRKTLEDILLTWGVDVELVRSWQHEKSGAFIFTMENLARALRKYRSRSIFSLSVYGTGEGRFLQGYEYFHDLFVTLLEFQNRYPVRDISSTSDEPEDEEEPCEDQDVE
jgi:hypothetical protein